MRKNIISKKHSQNSSEVQKLWQLLQNKEKQLKSKSRKTKEEVEYLNNLQVFLTGHHLNPQTNYIESKWNKKSEAVACGPEVIDK